MNGQRVRAGRDLEGLQLAGVEVGDELDGAVGADVDDAAGDRTRPASTVPGMAWSTETVAVVGFSAAAAGLVASDGHGQRHGGTDRRHAQDALSEHVDPFVDRPRADLRSPVREPPVHVTNNIRPDS